MELKAGYYYHVKQTFFQIVNDSTLMGNKEAGNYRPHYFTFQDSQNPDIFWLVPVSSKYEKYQKLHDQMVKKFKKCTKIVLGKCNGAPAAYLVQNAFPIVAKYIDHIHTSKGNPLTLHQNTAKLIEQNLQQNLKLHHKGLKLFFADIDRIYELMSEESRMP